MSMSVASSSKTTTTTMATTPATAMTLPSRRAGPSTDTRTTPQACASASQQQQRENLDAPWIAHDLHALTHAFARTPAVVLVLGAPTPHAVAPILRSPTFARSLLLLVTHAPPSLSALVSAIGKDNYTNGTHAAVRVLRLRAPLLPSAPAFAITLVGVLDAAAIVARNWRANLDCDSNSDKILQLAQNAAGDPAFSVEEPLADLPSPTPSNSASTSAPLPTNEHLHPVGTATRRSKLSVSTSTPPPTMTANLYTPNRAPRPPSTLSVESGTSKWAASTNSLSLKRNTRRDSSTSIRSVRSLSKDKRASTVNGMSGKDAKDGTRPFDALLSFLPPQQPEKAVLKQVVLISTLAGAFLAGAGYASFADAGYNLNNGSNGYLSEGYDSRAGSGASTPYSMHDANGGFDWSSAPSSPSAAYGNGNGSSSAETSRPGTPGSMNSLSGTTKKKRFSLFGGSKNGNGTMTSSKSQPGESAGELVWVRLEWESHHPEEGCRGGDGDEGAYRARPPRELPEPEARGRAVVVLGVVLAGVPRRGPAEQGREGGDGEGELDGDEYTGEGKDEEEELRMRMGTKEGWEGGLPTPPASRSGSGEDEVVGPGPGPQRAQVQVGSAAEAMVARMSSRSSSGHGHASAGGHGHGHGHGHTRTPSTTNSSSAHGHGHARSPSSAGRGPPPSASMAVSANGHATGTLQRTPSKLRRNSQQRRESVMGPRGPASPASPRSVSVPSAGSQSHGTQSGPTPAQAQPQLQIQTGDGATPPLLPPGAQAPAQKQVQVLRTPSGRRRVDSEPAPATPSADQESHTGHGNSNNNSNSKGRKEDAKVGEPEKEKEKEKQRKTWGRGSKLFFGGKGPDDFSLRAPKGATTPTPTTTPSAGSMTPLEKPAPHYVTGRAARAMGRSSPDLRELPGGWGPGAD
ncbi:hypothetical protein MVEN_00753200 [Mycena venus]|uniref:Uncharacterized protein n=1 Tax=Mycena venus TaxID=2733690 RepID=A0A8H6YL27_9AGAR|nr:hypothetical protein MVEN_00753200 [Mycena venus]